MGRCFCMLLHLLASIQYAHGHSTVSMAQLCNKSGSSVSLVTSSATIIVIDSFNHSQPCRVEISAPPPHHISMLVSPRRRAVEKPQVREPNVTEECPLTVSNQKTGISSVSVDLCSIAVIESNEKPELLPPVVVLEWHPQAGVMDEDLQALELVFAAVGRGREMCSSPDMWPCIARPPDFIYCVSTELVCEGFRNCPYSGNDEDEMYCANDTKFEEFPTGKMPWTKNFSIQFMTTEIRQRYIVGKNSEEEVDSTRTSTEKSIVLWFDDRPGKDHPYGLTFIGTKTGPIGFLGFGACGIIIILCGLFHCCCRRPKSGTRPPLSMVNHGTLNIPAASFPPTAPARYDDLDPPPSYTSLFSPIESNSQPIENPPKNTFCTSSSQSSNNVCIEMNTADCSTPSNECSVTTDSCNNE